MWSVHTRNETTSQRGILRRCTPTCRLARARPAGRGEGPSTAGVDGRKSSGKGAARGEETRAPLASTRVIRQPHRCRRCRRAPTSTMRLVLSHTQGVSRPHILLFDAARRTPEREESVRERFTRRPPSERSRAKRASGERDDRAPRERVLLLKWDLFEDFSETFFYNRGRNRGRTISEKRKAIKITNL